MSKIGRQPIDISKLEVKINGQDVEYKGPKAAGVYTIHDDLTPTIQDKELLIAVKRDSRDANRLWGLHRALLANAIKGATEGFEQRVIITGLGYKAVVSGNKATFSLGYSHKIEFPLPDGVTLSVDKTGQKLTFASHDKALLGDVCGKVKKLRPTEPYKGTGIRLEGETYIQKQGKTKSA